MLLLGVLLGVFLGVVVCVIASNNIPFDCALSYALLPTCDMRRLHTHLIAF